MKDNLAPIILFVYNRPWHTQQTLEALQKNELAKDSELFIYSDEAKNIDARKNVDEVRKYIDSIDGFKNITIIKRDTNFGLANSIIEGVSKQIKIYGKVIVLEDDLVTSNYFLNFMNVALDTFKNRDDIFSITGFSFSNEYMNFPKLYKESVYLNIRPMSWSWATWENKWTNIDWEVKDYNTFISDKRKIKNFEKGGTDLVNMLKLQMEGKLDSWYIRWAYNAYKGNKLTIYPTVSYVNNLGHDGSGVHCSIDNNNIYSHLELNNNMPITINKNIQLDFSIVRNFNKAFNIKIKSKIKFLLKRLLRL